MGDLVLCFEAPADPLSMNEKDNRSTGRAKQAWRDAAYYRYVAAHPGAGPASRGRPPSEVFVSLPFSTNRRRDPINYARTVKAIVDGLVRASAWPDDTPDWVTQHIPSLISGTDVIIRITDRRDT